MSAAANASSGSGKRSAPQAVWRFRELTPADAATIISWRYGGEFAFYDTEADPEFAAEFGDPSLWRLRDLEAERDVLLAGEDPTGTLSGFFSFRGSPDLCIIGVGLAPDLTGRSLGEGYMRAGLDFARRRWGVSRFRLEVVMFNHRAISVYARLGFVPVNRLSRAAQELGGRVVEWISMEVAAVELGPISTHESGEDDHG